LYLDLGDLQRSIPELESAARMVPREPQFQFALGNAYAKAGRKQDAARARAAFRRFAGDNSGNEPPGLNPNAVSSATKNQGQQQP
jgi:predicted Zn-dependent protease